MHRARNKLASPLRYEVHPEDLFRITDAIEQARLDLGAIYHSHTRSDPVPSQTDINLALHPETRLPQYPGALYVIVGLAGEEPDVRTWEILDGQVNERPLEVV